MTEAVPTDASSGVAPDGTPWSTQGIGEALVFVHGVGMNRAVWTPQVQAFARTHRTITYDLLGHGASPLPPASPCLADFSDQLLGLLTHLGLERVTLVGHSMGALVALDLALRRPECVQRLITLNAVHGRPPAQRQAVMDRARRLRENGAADSLEQTLARWFGVNAACSSRPDIQQIRDWLLAVDRDGYARAYQVFAEADDALAGRITELGAPALFLTGEFDPHSTPEMSTRLAAEVQRGEARVLLGERHMMAWETPGEVNQLIEDFIARTVDQGDTTAMPADSRAGG